MTMALICHNTMPIMVVLQLPDLTNLWFYNELNKSKKEKIQTEPIVMAKLTNTYGMVLTQKDLGFRYQISTTRG